MGAPVTGTSEGASGATGALSGPPDEPSAERPRAELALALIRIDCGSIGMGLAGEASSRCAAEATRKSDTGVPLGNLVFSEGVLDAADK